MVKRKCGTCRFFQDAEIACSGWCTHPERGDLHDLVLVRRAELACRNSWDQDLWEPIPSRIASTPTGHIDDRVPSMQMSPDNPTDRVTSIDIARPGSSFASGKVPPAVAGGQGARATVDTDEQAEPESVPSSTRNSGVSALEPSFQRALRGNGKREPRPTAGEPKEKPVIVREPARHEPEPPTPSMFQAPKLAPRRPGLANDTAPLPTDEVVAALEAASTPPEVTREPQDFQASVSTTSALDRELPVIHIDGLVEEAGVSRDVFSEPAVARNAAPLDDTPWVAAIPRCCDTCREFQRDSTGKSGYCGSPYAFQRRTMVKSEELACRSSIGVWWLPSDDTWLDRADVSHHTRPTPYLDAVLADLRPGSR